MHLPASLVSKPKQACPNPVPSCPCLQAYFYGAALGGGPRWGLAAGIVVVNLLGGVLEGLVAESTFNQFWHLMAVVFLNAGGWLQVWLLWGL